jgi:predicted DCC family thiol-disulfide oxidoreductase YuxK
MKSNPELLVLYDGDCGVCNRSVAIVLKRERNQTIHFSPIQSSFTQELFEKNGWPAPDLNTFYFIVGEKKYERSLAAFELMRHLEAPTSWLRIFRFLPRVFTDGCYNFVARRRKRISKGFCVIPTPEQQNRFV